MLFETKRLQVRKLNLSDALPFHKMQGNANVLRYTSGELKSFEENQEELKELIQKYDDPKNGFWIWAIDNSFNQAFIGTAAIIVDEKNEAEIGYRFLEKHWGNGYGGEVAEALIQYGLDKMKLKAIYAIVDIRNIASVKILDKTSLVFTKEEWNEDGQCMDRFYRLEK